MAPTEGAPKNDELPKQGLMAVLSVEDRWSIAWPAAICFAFLFHGVAFMAASREQPKVKQKPITMDIAIPEIKAPPEPPPPPPEPEKPKPKPKEPPPEDLPPPPPNADPPPEPSPEPPTPVTGVSAESVVESNTGGPQVRVGNTTFGDPNNEEFKKPSDVAPLPKAESIGPAFDAAGYRERMIRRVNKQKRYPRKARVLGLEGRCLVELKLAKDGSLLGEPRVFGKGTGHDVLDEECVRMAKAGAPYEALVGEGAPEPFLARLPIQFSLIDP
jgi:protein TonB